MCIAIYKPQGTAFPNKKTLERCFKRNPDGAGFMVAKGDEVEIHKGFMGFRSFWKTLRDARTKYGDDKAYVLHFRISTQGGVRPDGCHPFPLSGKMQDMRKLYANADIGVAHNGIIELTSSYSRHPLDYSDTMEFITEYLSLIIRDREYYKEQATLTLIEKLCGSRLAILDGAGHCELIGSGWEEYEGVWYSNSSYREPRATTVTYHSTLDKTGYCYDWGIDPTEKTEAEELAEYFDGFYNMYMGGYEFEPGECPMAFTGDGSYCDYCLSCKACYSFD